MTRLHQRTIRFEFPPDLRAGWHRTMPELACAANSVSLMMPYLEPYVVRAMRQALPHLDGDLQAEARHHIAQEAQHQAQHRKFNTAIAGQVRGVSFVERLMERTFDRLWERRSERFHLAYAAAAEAGAYGVARWVERHHGELFRDADATVAALYLWHLAEEVEHKNVAHDVYDARYGSRWPMVGAMAVSIAVFCVFTLLGTTVGLWHERRLFHPGAIARLLSWTFSFVFTELPNMAVSVLPGHHPSEFTDPAWFDLYLVGLERERTAA